MSWYPAGLDPIIRRFAEAIDKRFQPINPNGPVGLPGYTTTELSTVIPTRYAVAINTTTGKLVRAALNAGGTAYEWKNYDGSAL